MNLAWPGRGREVPGGGVANREVAQRLAMGSSRRKNSSQELVATFCERFVKVTTPFRAVRLVVPCSVPLPALRVAVTPVELSALPLTALRRLPNWSWI